MPLLALVARLYHRIESTSSQAERIFSALMLLTCILRTMAPFNVERTMFLRLNQRYSKEIKEYNGLVRMHKMMAEKFAQQTAAVQQTVAGRLALSYHSFVMARD